MAKKQALTFAILTSRYRVRVFYICIGKNHYFELRCIGDFYFVWKGLKLLIKNGELYFGGIKVKA